MKSESKKKTPAQTGEYPIMGDTKDVFFKCLMHLVKDYEIPRPAIAKKITDNPEDAVKMKQKLHNIVIDLSSGDKEMLIKLINAYPLILKPFLGIEIDYEQQNDKIKRMEEQLQKLQTSIEALTNSKS